MADQRRGADRRDAVGARLELGRRQAEPGEPGIDVDRRRGFVARRDGCPGLDLSGMVEHRVEPRRDKFSRGAGQGAVEHGDFRFRPERLAQRDALVERRDKKPPATRREQRPPHRRGAEPVAVRLDHRGADGGRRLGREQPPIGDDRAEVDLENSAGARGGVAGRGHTKSSFPRKRGVQAYQRSPRIPWRE